MAKQWTVCLPGIRQSKLLSAVGGVMFLSCCSAFAETVVFGTSASNNAQPFGAYYNGSTYQTSVGMEYTQIYDRSGFSASPFLITDLGFVSLHLQTGRGTIAAEYDVEISFAYTQREPSGTISASDGPMVSSFSGATSAALTEFGEDFDLTFHLTQPFTFDPSQGNLALRVVVRDLSFDETTNQNGFTFRAGSSPLMARDVPNMPPFYGLGLQPYYGLVTAFSSDGSFPTYPVPEPSAGSLFAIFGVGALLCRPHRSRRR